MGRSGEGDCDECSGVAPLREVGVGVKADELAGSDRKRKDGRHWIGVWGKVPWQKGSAEEAGRAKR